MRLKSQEGALSPSLLAATLAGMGASVQQPLIRSLASSSPTVRAAAARALGDLYMHANTFTMDQAIQYASDWTPRGWLPTDGNTVWFEQHLYLQQPMYGTSYLVGKIQIEDLIARMARQQGDAFTLKGFMDAVDDAGMIPMALIAWELTGDDETMVALMAP